MPENLMDIVKSTLTANKGNSVIGFKDNSSAIRGGPVTPMLPKTPGTPSALEPQASAGARAVLRDERGRDAHFPISSFFCTAVSLYPLELLRPCMPVTLQARDWDVLLTAETHNFPCAVAPYPGAETGAGGRIRDTHATGIGSIMGAATAGYCVGNLHIDG